MSRHGEGYETRCVVLGVNQSSSGKDGVRNRPRLIRRAVRQLPWPRLLPTRKGLYEGRGGAARDRRGLAAVAGRRLPVAVNPPRPFSIPPAKDRAARVRVQFRHEADQAAGVIRVDRLVNRDGLGRGGRRGGTDAVRRLTHGHHDERERKPPAHVEEHCRVLAGSPRTPTGVPMESSTGHGAPVGVQVTAGGYTPISGRKKEAI